MFCDQVLKYTYLLLVSTMVQQQLVAVIALLVIMTMATVGVGMTAESKSLRNHDGVEGGIGCSQDSIAREKTADAGTFCHGSKSNNNN